jgi:hypothetical protein
MAGKIVVSTLNNDTGVLATQNGMTGIAKAWVNFDGTGTPAIRASFNVSSITDNGTGDYTVNFTTAMPNANYSIACSNDQNSGLSVANPTGTSPPTTASVRILTWRANGTPEDSTRVSVNIFSS